MADLQGRKVFKVFNQDFIVDERYTVTKELGQGAYGIVWYVSRLWCQRAAQTSTLLPSPSSPFFLSLLSTIDGMRLTILLLFPPI